MILCFGGTFDPIHLGHLQGALAASTALGGAPVRLVLSARPSHRDTPGASIAQRLHMLQLVCAEHDCLQVDSREVERDKPSYTVDTLLELRAEFPDQPIAWVIGTDAFHLLPTWYRWREVLELAHLVVLQRIGYVRPPTKHAATLAAALAGREVSEAEAAPGTMQVGLHGQAGQVLTLAAALPDISATDIRQRLRQGYPVAHLLPGGVATYIRQRQIYAGTT